MAIGESAGMELALAVLFALMVALLNVMPAGEKYSGRRVVIAYGIALLLTLSFAYAAMAFHSGETSRAPSVGGGADVKVQWVRWTAYTLVGAALAMIFTRHQWGGKSEMMHQFIVYTAQGLALLFAALTENINFAWLCITLSWLAQLAQLLYCMMMPRRNYSTLIVAVFSALRVIYSALLISGPLGYHKISAQNETIAYLVLDVIFYVGFLSAVGMTFTRPPAVYRYHTVDKLTFDTDGNFTGSERQHLLPVADGDAPTDRVITSEKQQRATDRKATRRSGPHWQYRRQASNLWKRATDGPTRWIMKATGEEASNMKE